MSVTRFDPARDDVAVLAALHGESFAQGWTVKALTDLLGTPGACAFWTDDGFVLARAAGGEAEILTLAVRPAARGKGLGRALLQAALAQASKDGAGVMFLEVGTDNPAALALYAGLGFAKVGQRKGYYDGGDALILSLALPQTSSGV